MTSDDDELIKLWSEITPTDVLLKKYGYLHYLINESHYHILNGRHNQFNKTVKKTTDLSKEIRKDRQKQMKLLRLCLKYK